MSASWQSFRGPGPAARPRRFRGDEIPTPSPVSWRDARRHAQAQAKAAQTALRRGRDEGDPASDASLRILGLTIDLDAVFAFGIFLPIVYMSTWGAKGAAMVAGLTPLYLFVRRKKLERVLLPRAIFFLFPLFALFSTVWSVAAKDTLRMALELSITITAAQFVSSARNQGAVLRAIALAFIIYVAEAIAIGGKVNVGVGAGGQAFSGLTESKNLMADIASTSLIVSIAAIMFSLRDRKWYWLPVLGVGVLMDLYCVVGARSAGALMGLALGLAPFFGLTPLLNAGRPLRAWVTAAVALTMLMVGIFYQDITEALMNLSATLFQKDSTLTGRTYLWYRAFDLIHNRPVLGQGYMSFWIQGNMDAEGLWQYGGIVSRSGFSFHNTLIDILVTLGWAGAGVVLATAAIGVIGLIRRFVLKPDLALLFWVGIMLYELSRTPIETLGIQPFAFTTMLVWGALGAAFGRIREPRAAHRPIRAAVVQVWPVNYAAEAWANPRIVPVRGALRLRKPEEVSS